MAQSGLSSTAQPGPQRWPLLQRLPGPRTWPLLVVLHGHGGGEIPELLRKLLQELQAERRSPVWVQALTADPVLLPPEQDLLLVPLLLTPGSHVRSDLPAIRRRLRSQGHRVIALPFLGAWAPWLQHLRQLGCKSDCSVVLHHPLRAGVADRYLGALSQAIGLPLLRADAAPDDLDHALPLALAPNRMTAHLRASNGGGLALLEQAATRQFLYALLRDLP